MLSPASIPVTELHRHLGAILVDDSVARFTIWSPTSLQVTLELVQQNGSATRSIDLAATDGGYHVVEVADVAAGDRYRFRFDGGPALPDPASRYQPEGVHGASAIVDRDHSWQDGQWKGVSTKDLIIYELHIGSLTDPGTFIAAIDRLDELADLGITALELLPVADAAGRWNWGYDGVNLFAPNRNFGAPDDFRRFVDQAHRRGLAVILDVVYNHLGPEGNYLGQSGPYLSDRHHTVWGSAPNFDDPVHGDQLRRFFIANAIYWLDEFHIDGLRVDAIHCMNDDREPHVVHELSDAVRDWSKRSGRPGLLVAESNVYDEEMLSPTSRGGCGFDAQWGDDFLHSLFAVVRPGEQLCHRTYRSGSDLEQVLRLGYVYAGTLRGQRGRWSPESPTGGDRINTDGLIYSIQNHDFIGNHPLGKRLHELTSLETQRAAAAMLILAPAIPMLFMGEEFACANPFAFFVDFGDESLKQAVIAGRRREYPQHDWSAGSLPTDPEAFYRSKIGPAQAGDSAMRSWYRELISLRKTWNTLGLIASDHVQVHTDLDAGLFVMSYRHHNHQATVAVRLNPTGKPPTSIEFQAPGKLILDSIDHSPGGVLEPNQARIWIDDNPSN